ncbi:MAG: hypothetical protein IJW27_03865 [Clostridia bacterium]|nr:hypothetical protein [Clostridia bacterium]
MLDLLREKQLYENWVLAVLPLVAVSASVKTGLLISVITVLALIISSLAVFALKALLTEKTAPFARLIISVGVVGISATLLGIFFKEDIASLGIYVNIAAVSAVLLVRSDFVISADLSGLISGCGLSAAVGSAFLIVSSLIREFFGNGSLLGFDIYSKYLTPIAFLKTPAGGLLTTAVLLTVYCLLVGKNKMREEEQK